MENPPFPLSEQDIADILHKYAAAFADVIDVVRLDELTEADFADVMARLLVARTEIIDDVVSRAMRWPIEKAAGASLISKALLAKPILEATANAVSHPEIAELVRSILKPYSARLAGNAGLH